jgi:hypothetical protein
MTERPVVFEPQGACLSKHEVLPAIAELRAHPAKSADNADGGLASDHRPHERWRCLHSLSGDVLFRPALESWCLLPSLLRCLSQYLVCNWPQFYFRRIIRFRLRTLLILMAVGPMLIAAAWFLISSILAGIQASFLATGIGT